MESGKSMRYAVRPADLTDMSELLRMQMALQASMEEAGCHLLRINRASTAKLRDYYHAEIQNEHVRLLIAETIDPVRAVGMGTGKIWVHTDYLPPQSGELLDLWVDPDHRRGGVAKRIIGQLLQFFRDRGADFITVNYVEGNELGKRLWEKLGFERALVTATADRAEAERALDTAPSRAVPVTYQPAWAKPHEGTYSPSALSK